MVQMIQNRQNIIHNVLFFMSFILLAACSTNPADTGSRPSALAHIKLERVDSVAAEVKHAYLSLIDDEVVLRGEVQRKMHKRGTVPGHLHVQVLDSRGEVLDDDIVCTTMKCRKTGTAKFIYKTGIPPEQISSIRIVHHDTHSHS